MREFQLWMINELKSSWSQFNQAVCALRFFYTYTYKRDWVVQQIPFGPRPKTLPVVLSGDEVARLIACVKNIKHRTFLLTLFSSGLRISEGLNLKITDIDSERMMLKVNQGKGVYRCEPCNYETTVCNSCGDRNCPLCSGAKRCSWLDSTQKLTIPQATYFQVVFTLPEQLSSLTLGNRTAIYNLLFETAWESLQAKIRVEESDYLANLINELQLKNWVAFIEGPPRPDCPPSPLALNQIIRQCFHRTRSAPKNL